MPDRDWCDEVVDAARAAGHKADRDCPTSVLMADARNLLAPGSPADTIAGNLAADLAGHAPEPVTRATCEALVRAAANLRGLTAMGIEASELLAILGAAAAKLEMRATP